MVNLCSLWLTMNLQNLWLSPKIMLFMKPFHYIFIIIYALVAAYFLYMTAISLFVYFSNKSMGHNESFFESGKNFLIALLFSFFTFSSWFLIRNQNYHKIGLIIFYIPIVLIGLYLLWALTIIIGSGGKWN